MKQTHKERIFILVINGALVLLGLSARFLASTMIALLPDCVYGRFGITCPSCGGTRCIRELFSGHFGKAFLLHPFFFCLSFYLAAALVLLDLGYLLQQKHCQKIGKAMIGGKAIITLAVIYAIFGIARMLLMLPL